MIAARRYEAVRIVYRKPSDPAGRGTWSLDDRRRAPSPLRCVMEYRRRDRVELPIACRWRRIRINLLRAVVERILVDPGQRRRAEMSDHRRHKPLRSAL